MLKEVPIEKVNVQTHREDYGDLGSLTDSIRSYGIIQPLVVEEFENGYILILAGRRRLRAAMVAGLKVVPVVTKSDLSPPLRRELELEENLHRKDLTWDEECKLKLAIDELKREFEGTAMQGKVGDGRWTQEKLATALDQSPGKVSQDLKLATFMRDNPEVASKIRHLPKTAALRKIKQFETAKELREKIEAGTVQPEVGFENVDARKGLAKLEPESIDLILTDPPWGAGVEQGLQEATAKQTHLRDLDNLSPDQAQTLFKEIAFDLHQVLKPGRHIYIFCAIKGFEVFRTTLQNVGFHVSPYPLVWYKGKNQTPGTGLNYMRSYELILFGYKPAPDAVNIRALKSNHMDVLGTGAEAGFRPLSSSQRSHAFEKPPELLEFLMRQSSEIGETVLDPFAGVASMHRVARKVKGRGEKSEVRVPISFELDQCHYARGLELIRKETKSE